ncbi:hypothetical protein EOI86_22785 [Hwanghaeella grinnelliae]|uniref:FecR protein domain-containing protein n=1 Tax=Hwanghaeella grinnelliae TaxID=2500179 RepID=A0A3S2VKF3_9PROT|nr:FecR domain-containing protein [Hwanghaeella grinnelliae]RVU33955.1 hypothetical protein EOI86_22785 [Hwanghaeella grinnelliae]
MNRFHLLASASLLTFIVGQPGYAQDAAEVAGSAMVAIPSIQAVLGESAPRTIAIGNEIFRNENITTGPEGHLHILFRDESNMTLGPNASITIDEYVYDPVSGTGTMVVQQAAGVMRFIGGAISKSGSVNIATVVGTIGVRGGVALVRVLEGGGIQAFFVFGDQMTVDSINGDSIAIDTAGFSFNISADGEISPPAEINPSDLGDALGALETPTGSATAVNVPDAVLNNLQDRLEQQTVDPDTGLVDPLGDEPITVRELETILGTDVLEEEAIQEVFEEQAEEIVESGSGV